MEQREIELHIYHKTSVKVFQATSNFPLMFGVDEFQTNPSCCNGFRSKPFISTIYLDASSVECRNTIQEHPCVE